MQNNAYGYCLQIHSTNFDIHASQWMLNSFRTHARARTQCVNIKFDVTHQTILNIAFRLHLHNRPVSIRFLKGKTNHTRARAHVTDIHDVRDMIVFCAFIVKMCAWVFVCMCVCNCDTNARVGQLLKQNTMFK